jgi:5-methyltetrahydrofolate--homocysteine methyltransferase
LQFETIFQNVIDGDAPAVEAGVKAALASGAKADVILQDGLIGAMREVGRRYEAGDLYVPEMLIAARAMQAGLALLKPQLVESGAKSAGRVVIGTVKGDLHDIGKNLVGMMLEGAGYEVIDLGTDVGPEKFAEAARQHQAGVVGLSALLTTTMQNMKSTIEALEDIGVRSQVKVIVGGAPVTRDYAKQIGADGYAPDASSATRLVRELLP